MVGLRLHLSRDSGNALRLTPELRERVLLRRILQRIKIGHRGNLETCVMRLCSRSLPLMWTCFLGRANARQISLPVEADGRRGAQ